MKKIFLLLLTAGALFSCQEEFIGQYPVDSIPPKPITNVEQVEQVSGGAILSSVHRRFYYHFFTCIQCVFGLYI